MTDNSSDVQHTSEILRVLDEHVGKTILIKLKNNTLVEGDLKRFDQHMNICVTKVTVKINEENKHFDEVILHGSNVSLVSLTSHSYAKSMSSGKSQD